MSTGIEWTDRTWNPLTGCTKVTPGCDHCYAKTMHERFNGPGSFDTVTLHPERLDQPLRWRKPARVFVNSMSDLFHRDVPDEYIAWVFGVMALAPEHTFQILTKRHGRMRSLLSSGDFRRMVGERVGVREGVYRRELVGWPLPNVWAGVSVENQQWADLRPDALRGTPAAVRFLSVEPLLGPVTVDLTGIDWVIVGGESGPGARPMHPGWARSLRDQCVAAGVPFLFKQWGAWAPHDVARPTVSQLDYHGTHWDGTDAAMARVGKKAAGRELDGRTWDQYPETVPA